MEHAMIFDNIDNIKCIFDNCSDLVVCLSKKGKIITLNKSAKSLFNLNLSSSNKNNFHKLCRQLDKEIQWTKCDLKNIQGHIYGKIYIGKIILDSLSQTIKVRDIKDYYENIISLMPGHVYWQDRNGMYLGCNEQQAKSAGLTDKKDIVNKTNKELPWNLSASVAVEQVDKINQDVMRTGVPLTIEEPGISANGIEAIYLSKKHPLKDKNNHVVGILGISFDITERKKYEQLLEQAKEQAETANQIKSDFIACMSHDLRTPLNGIFGSVQILQKNTHYPEQEAFIENISKSADNLLYLVEDILNFTKLESGKVQLHSEAFDMRKLIEDVVSLVASQANQKGIKLIISYCNSVPCFIISDPKAIRRILINLVGNAIKFTDSGHILISVDLVKTNSKEATIQLSVADTGIGIPREKISTIFDSFSRVHPSYSSHYQGAGLGLAIAKKLSEILGSTINVNSQLSCGSTFWCNLPVKLQDKARANSIWLQIYSKIKILIVDDYHVRAKNIKKQLASSASAICESHETMQIIHQAYQTNDPFQIVIIDDEIIYESAIELAQMIKKTLEFQHIMLVLFSGPRTLPENELAQSSGFFKQLIKPVQPKELSHELASAWEAWKESTKKQLKNHENKKAKILLVEDDTIAQTISKKMLQQLGYIVDVASSGKKAIQNVLEKKYDIIFMDIGLPDKDGITVTKEILKSCKGNAPKIFGLTAHAFEHNRVECISAGMSSFITKPVSYEDFEKILSSSSIYVKDTSL
jgi:signal transduction histidine kinase/DNA-binding response OmpR family regulator